MDRTYSVGLRYEFHPLNSSSPYHDNACTATRVVQASEQGGPAPADARTDGLAVAHADRSNGHTKLWTSAAIGGLVVVALAAVALARQLGNSDAG
ncbi:hypothetical protein GCM10009665_06980 [Kitasatospora nipponensis]|uniref:MYXO-CTERM domain-containing protein n=1 Tax=Kitasatospora nipponensis TaxID=258049 RepID=A0ABN1VUB0_9ACTN